MSESASFGGAGWEGREGTHAEDLGAVWARCGVESEVTPLRSVLLIAPPRSIAAVQDPNAALFLAPPRYDALLAEFEGLVAAYQREGVHVHVWRAPPHAQAHTSPNLIFARDLFWMGPDGAVLGRMGAAARRGEERDAQRALAEAGVPIVGFLRGPGTLEGADALWVGPREVMVGVGFRTNAAGADQLEAYLAPRGVRVERVPLAPGGGVQHLLGALNPFAPMRACYHPRALPQAAYDSLRKRGWDLVPIEDEEEREQRRALNFVTLRPGVVLLPDDAPRTLARLEKEGVVGRGVTVTEYRSAAGAMGCLTGVLHRGTA